MAKRWSAARMALASALVASVGALSGMAGARAASQSSCPSAGQTSVIVEATSAGLATAAVRSSGGRVDKSLDLVNAVAATVPTSALSTLANRPGVLYVSRDPAVSMQADGTPPRDASAAYPAVVGAPALWAQGVTGGRAAVAVVDTGIDPVADLAGRVIGGVDLSGGGDPFNDEFGHGTFVAGIIAGNGASSSGAVKGMAPGANLVSVKIAGADGSADVSQILAAIQWVVSFRSRFDIRVLNLSLGTDSTQPYDHSLLDAAVERAWDAGIVVVTSASNRGPTPGSITKPGDDPLVITAGAIDDAGTVARGDDSIPGFSAVGPTADGFAKPDLVAPGRSILSLRAPGSTIDSQFGGARVGDAYFRGSGTSFSTAVTSGAAALLLDANPKLTPDQVKSRLLGTAAPAPSSDPNIGGRGSLDVAAASGTTGPDTSQAGIARSSGDGVLDADRGHTQVTTASGPSSCDGGRPAGVIAGDTTAQGRQFDRAAFNGPWDGSSWYGSSWYGSSWYGSSWYGSSWYGSSWYGSSWYGSSWYGSSWYGSSWYGSSWYGSSWYGSSWYAVLWQ